MSQNFIRNKIASKITQDYLKTITVHKSGIKILWIDFIMTKIMNRRLLSGVNFISTEPRSVKDDAGGFDGFSYSLAVSVNSKNEDASGGAVFEPVSMYNNVKQYEYRFNYYLGDNQKDLWPIASPLIYTDSWGYYSTAKSQWEIASDGAKASDYKLRPASLESTRKFVLKSIKYPTGGKTVFDYELNDYSKVFNLQTPSVTEEQGTSGGLRVKTLSNFDASDNLLYYKQYTYRNSNGKSSGISKGTPVFYDHINFNSDGTNFIDFYSYDDINPYPMNFNTPSVGYSTILETLYDANGHVLTTTEYQYTNYDADINNNAHMDVRADYAANVFGNRNYACAAFTSLAFERGKLVSKKVMDGQANVLEKCTYKYNRVAGNAYTTVSQEFYNAVVEEQHTTRQLALSYMYKTYTNKYLVSVNRREETMNNGKYITEQRYEYNNYGLPSKKTVISNNGERLQTSYSYNSDYHGSKNLILPAEVEERKGNGISNIVYHYDDSNMGVPYVSKQESLWSYANYGSSPFKVRTDYTVDRVDQYGNPIIWNQQGVKTVMVWSFKGQRLIASIQKASCDEVVAALGKNPEEYSALNNTTLSLDFLRTALPNALVYTYQYDNRLNLISKTDPNGLIHTYTYDSLNRLTSEYRKYNNKTELLKTYQYNFKTK